MRYSYDWYHSLGFACVIEGRGEGNKKLRAADGRRPKNNPHLRHSLESLWEVFDYLKGQEIRVFRLPSSLVPYATHKDYPHLNWKKQITEAHDEIAETRKRLKGYPLRLSFHPSQFVLLNSPRKEVHKNSLEELRWQARVLDLLGQGSECRVLLHGGGVYDNRAEARSRLEKNLASLPEEIHSRLALENDDRLWSAIEIEEVCRSSGLPMIFDIHHHACHPDGRYWLEALQGALETWGELRPKIHLSSPRLQGEKNKYNPRAHADYIDPWAFARFREKVAKSDLVPFDIMLEAKKKDLALLELRKSLSVEGKWSP